MNPAARISRRIILLMALLSCLVIGLQGCASKKVISESTSIHERLFPNGTYRHRVHLRIPARENTEEKKFGFNGVVQIQEDVIRIVALTPFGTTAFRLTEERRTGEIKTEIYVDGMKKFEPRLKQYYSVLRRLLLLPARSQSGDGLAWVKFDTDGRPLELKIEKGEPQATFYFEKYDEHRLPEKMRVESPDFQVQIDVSAYEI